MKYLKTFETIKTSHLPPSKRNESFEYEGARFIEKICKGWGVEVEDLEDLFVEFSDDGGKVLFSPMEVKDGIIQITIRDIYEDLDDGEWLYNPIWDERFRSIKGSLKRMGLDMNVIAKSLNHGRYVNLRIFKYCLQFPLQAHKFKRSTPQFVKESFEMKLGTMDILNKYGFTKDDIEELFLEFSDMGYHIKMLPGFLGTTQLYVDILDVGKKSYEPEFSELVKKVIRESTKLGLYLVESPKRITQFPDRLNFRFIFNK